MSNPSSQITPHVKMKSSNTTTPLSHTPKSQTSAMEQPSITPPSSLQDHIIEPPRKSLSFHLAFLSLMATNFISIMDTVIVAVALPAISHSLHSPSNTAYWAGSGFLFAQAVSQPLYGTLSSVFSRKTCLLFAMCVFTIASVFCATARSMEWLVAARVVSCEFLLGVSGDDDCED